MAKTEKYTAHPGSRRSRRYAYLAAVAATLAIFYIGYHYEAKRRAAQDHYEAKRRAAQEHYQAHHQDIVTAALVDVDGKQHVLRVWSNPYDCSHEGYIDLFSPSENRILWSRDDVPMAYPRHVVDTPGRLAIIARERASEIAHTAPVHITALDLASGQILWRQRETAFSLVGLLKDENSFTLLKDSRGVSGVSLKWSDGSPCHSEDIKGYLEYFPDPTAVTAYLGGGVPTQLTRLSFADCSVARSYVPKQAPETTVTVPFRDYCADIACYGSAHHTHSTSGNDVELKIFHQYNRGEPWATQLGVVSTTKNEILWQTESKNIANVSVINNKRYSPFLTLQVTLRDYEFLSIDDGFHLIAQFYLMIDGDTGQALMASRSPCLPIGEGYTCGKILYTKDWQLVANDQNGLPKPDKDYRALLSKYQPNIPWADEVKRAADDKNME